MLSFFSAKGGAGCSVTSAAVALLSSFDQPTLLADLNGDQPDILGIDHHGPGIAEWLEADNPLPDALRRLEVPVTEHLSLLPLGRCRIHPRPEQGRILAAILASEGRPVVLDIGLQSQRAIALLAASDRTVLVTRACYLALRAARCGPTPDDIVLVTEPGRALRPSDVSATLGIDGVTTVPWDPAIARAVDAGLLRSRLPRPLRRLATLL